MVKHGQAGHVTDVVTYCKPSVVKAGRRLQSFAEVIFGGRDVTIALYKLTSQANAHFRYFDQIPHSGHSNQVVLDGGGFA